MEIISAVEIDKAVKCLVDGGVLVCPTDTIYGLSCIYGNKKVEKRVFGMKQREDGKKFIILANGWDMICDIADVDEYQRRILSDIWPGPVTAVLKTKGGEETVAVRWPDHDWLDNLIRHVGRPIISTSCNVSGRPNITAVSQLEEVFLSDMPDVVVDGGVLDNKPSRIIDLTGDSLKIIRE